MRTVPTGLWLVTCCGLTACANQVDDFGLEEQIGSVSQAEGPTNNNGLDTYKVTDAPLLIDTGKAGDLVSNRLYASTLTTAVRNEICGNARSNEVFKYVVMCALNTSTSITLTSCYGGNQTWWGTFGLAQAWNGTGGTCDATCQKWVSACMLAHSNFKGESVQIQIAGSNSALNQSHNANFTYEEAAYWGDIFNDDGAGQKKYGCYGDDANQLYYSSAMNGNKKLMSRVCAYYNSNGECKRCQNDGSEGYNICNSGTIYNFLDNLDANGKVVDCWINNGGPGSLCSWTTTTVPYGYYRDCGGGTGSNIPITVWRDPD